jgi:flagellar hook-associated protein 1 FlgK
VEGFTRFIDNLLTKQMLEQRSKTSYTNTLLQSVAGLDSMLMDPSASISVAVSKFLNAAGTLANDASSLTNKQTFAAAATDLANRISSFNEYINDTKKSTQANMTSILSEANSLAPALQRINQQILASSSPGFSTPSADILDERDRITMRMQDLLGGSTLINEDGTASFQMAGVALVDRMNASQFINTDVGVSDGALFNIFIKNSETGRLTGPLSTVIGDNPNFNGAPAEQEFLKPKTVFNSGQVGATFELLTDFFPEVQRQLGALTLGIFRDVNKITATGPLPSDTGQVFGFRASGGGETKVTPADLSATWLKNSDGKWEKSSAAGSAVLTIEQIMDASDPKSKSYNDTIAGLVNNPSYSASSFISLISYGPEVALSFSVNATQANQIQSLRSTFTNPLTLITTDIASTISSWKNVDKVNQVISKQLDDRRESISGVNLDEEAANLVKFQQMYGAASKVMQTANQMFNMLLNMLSE